MHTDLHRRERYRGPVGVRRVVREVGAALPGGIRLWDNGWSEFIPLQGSTTWRYGGSSCSTNAIESLNARYRRAIKAVGTSRRSKPRLSVPISSPDLWTRPGSAGHDGRCGGNQRWTRSRSPSATDSRPPKPTH